MFVSWSLIQKGSWSSSQLLVRAFITISAEVLAYGEYVSVECPAINETSIQHSPPKDSGTMEEEEVKRLSEPEIRVDHTKTVFWARQNSCIQ